MAGISDFLGLIGKIGDWIIPNKKEHLRKVIQDCERKMNEFQKIPNPTDSDIIVYERLSRKLREAQDAIEKI